MKYSIEYVIKYCASVFSLWAVIFFDGTATPPMKLLRRPFVTNLFSPEWATVSFNVLAIGFFGSISHTSSNVEGGRVEAFEIMFPETSFEHNGLLLWFTLAIIESFDSDSIISYSLSGMNLIFWVLLTFIESLNTIHVLFIIFFLIFIDGFLNADIFSYSWINPDFWAAKNFRFILESRRTHISIIFPLVRIAHNFIVRHYVAGRLFALIKAVHGSIYIA